MRIIVVLLIVVVILRFCDFLFFLLNLGLSLERIGKVCLVDGDILCIEGIKVENIIME